MRLQRATRKLLPRRQLCNERRHFYKVQQRSRIMQDRQMSSEPKHSTTMKITLTYEYKIRAEFNTSIWAIYKRFLGNIPANNWRDIYVMLLRILLLLIRLHMCFQKDWLSVSLLSMVDYYKTRLPRRNRNIYNFSSVPLTL